MGDPKAPSDDKSDRSEAPPREKTGTTPPGGEDEGARGGGSAAEQARLDREAGDVADDLADFA